MYSLHVDTTLLWKFFFFSLSLSSHYFFDLADISIDSSLSALEVWFVGVADLNCPMACWSQGNVESLFPRRSLAAPLGLFPLHGKSLLCCTMKDVDYIRHFIRQDRPGHFLQICDTRVQKQGFECSGGKKEKKNSIQFVLHSAINSVKWLFFKIEKKKPLKSFGCEKVVITNWDVLEWILYH